MSELNPEATEYFEDFQSCIGGRNMPFLKREKGISGSKPLKRTG
jgi:hypothetical protein